MAEQVPSTRCRCDVVLSGRFCPECGAPNPDFKVSSPSGANNSGSKRIAGGGSTSLRGESKQHVLKRIAWAIYDGCLFCGEVAADFLGLTDSHYQYVVDAYERHMREMERDREDAAAEEALVAAERAAEPRAVETSSAELAVIDTRTAAADVVVVISSDRDGP